MMKKWFGLILAICLMSYTYALAETVQTRERTIIVEGCEEIITETLYESPKGFTIWYPADCFSVRHEDDFDQFISVVEDLDIGLSIIDAEMSYTEADELLKAVIAQSTADGGEVLSEIEEWDLASGVHVKYVEIIQNNVFHPVCYLYGNERVFAISFNYPAEAAEGFGSRIMEMISTFELVDPDAAQTRKCAIVLGEAEEAIEEMLYESEHGYHIWYPANVFTAYSENGGDFFDTPDETMGLAIVDSETSDEYIDEELEALIELSVANNGDILGEVETWQTTYGVWVKHADIAFEDMGNSVYFLYGNGRIFCVSCYFPQTAAETFSAYAEHMIDTFQWN